MNYIKKLVKKLSSPPLQENYVFNVNDVPLSELRKEQNQEVSLKKSTGTSRNKLCHDNSKEIKFLENVVGYTMKV